MTATSVLRLRRVLAEHGTALAVALILVGALALGSAVWIERHPPTTQITEPTDEQTVTTALETRATVTGPTSLYEQGRTLRNKAIYLQDGTPTVTLLLRTATASETSIRVDQRLVMVTSARKGRSVFWSENRTLARTQTSGESVVTRADVNVTRLRERLAERQQALGDAGRLSTHLLVRVGYDTGRYSGSFSRRIPIDLGDDWYAISPVTLSKNHQESVTRTTTVPRSVWTYLAPGLAGLVALLSGVVVAGLQFTRFGTVDDDLTRRIQHQTHAEWISTGSLDEVDIDRAISLSSLEDLVDVAIDTDRRVVHDPSRNLYVVVDDAAVYSYRRPVDDWE